MHLLLSNFQKGGIFFNFLAFLQYLNLKFDDIYDRNFIRLLFFTAHAIVYPFLEKVRHGRGFAMSAFSVLWSIDVCLEIVSVTKQNVHVEVDIFNLYGDFSLLFSWKSSSRIEYTVELFHIYRIE